MLTKSAHFCVQIGIENVNLILHTYLGQAAKAHRITHRYSREDLRSPQSSRPLHILERQKDKVTAEWKYCINGQSLGGSEVEVVAKLSPTGKLVIITVYVP